MSGSLRVTLPRSKPRENHRHAAANRFPALEPALPAHKKHGLLTGGRKVAYMCPLEINVGFGQRRGDFIARQTTGAGYESRDAGDFE